MQEKKNPKSLEALAGESEMGSDDASALPQRLSRYSIAHRRALHMSKYARSQKNHQIADNLQSCGHWLLFRDYFTIDKMLLHSAKFCRKHLLCPLCAIRRGAKYLKAYLEKLKLVQAEQPAMKAYLVTFTVKNGECLKERYYHLRQAMKKMTQARRDHLSNPRKNRHVEFAKALGGVHSIEFKRGANSGLWHPHTHMVWLCNEKPDAFKLSAEWEYWTGDSFIVDVTEFHDQDDIVSGFMEVFKYALKFSELELADNWHAFEVLSNKRLVDSFGCLRGVEISDDYTDGEIDDMPYVEMLYEYTRNGYELRKLDNVNVATGEVGAVVGLDQVMQDREPTSFKPETKPKAIYSLYTPPAEETDLKPAACASEDCKGGNSEALLEGNKMGCYAIQHFENGLCGPMYLHRSPNGNLIFDYPTQIGNPSRNDLVRFEYEGDCEAFLMANLSDEMIGFGFTAWLE
jgi:hypothetical protein